MPNNCLGDIGYVKAEALKSSATAKAALARQVASAIIAIDNANRLVANYKDQRDIAQRAQDIAKAQQDQLETVFWPREEEFLTEFSNPEPIETVEVMGARYAGRLVSSIAAAFAREFHALRCSARRYCTGANQKQLQDLMMARGSAMASARVLGRNIAFAEFQARTDINLSRRMQAVSLGRGLINDAMTLLSAAGRGYAAAGAEIGANLSSAIEAFQTQRSIRADALESGTAQDRSYAPGTTGRGWNGGQHPNAVAKQNFGLQSSTERFRDTGAASVMQSGTKDMSATNKPGAFENLQVDKGNEGRVGNSSLARTGIYTFPVISGSAVVVDMSKFPLFYTDHLGEGYTSGIV
jgi:hypothetical protein